MIFRKISRRTILIFSILLISMGILALFLSNYYNPFPSKKKVVVINLNSMISYDNIDINKLISILKDQKYDGIIFKVDSPGGDLSILRIVEYAKNISKPTVCYIDGQTTSAAYWLCSQTNYIIARKDSIVGNIGAYAIIITYVDLLKKLGINVTIFKATPHKTIGAPLEYLTDEEKSFLNYTVTYLGNQFIKDVLSKRNIKNESFALSGYWFIADFAKELNLIDSIGEFEDAKKVIANMLNTTVDNIEFYEINLKKERTIFDYLSFSLLKNLMLNPYEIKIIL